MSDSSILKPSPRLSMVNLQYPRSLTSINVKNDTTLPACVNSQPNADSSQTRYVSPYEVSLVRAYTTLQALQTRASSGGQLFMNALSSRNVAPCWSSQPSAAATAIYGRPLSKRSANRPRRDSEDLVATGTNPLQPQCGTSRRSASLGGQTNGLHTTQSSGAFSQMGSIGRKLPTKSNVFGPSGTTRSREYGEPKYGDPLQGGPPSFQQRLAEINSLEQETIRYERAKKFKKKAKSET